MGHRRNVQQQNEIALTAMLRIAQKAREDGLPIGVAHFLLEHGIDPDVCAVVSLEMEGYMLGLEFGFGAFIVTPDLKIFNVELELNAAKELLQVIVFDDVTDKQNFSKHNPGTGWGWGALALEGLRRLNAS